MSDEVVLHLRTSLVHFRPRQPTWAHTEQKKHGVLLKALTIDLVKVYTRCSREFGYSFHCAPRRVLTKNSKGVHNGGHDNSEHDYICLVGDCINNPDGHSYEILEQLGRGTFGQVLKCQSSQGNQLIALKIIRNKPAYFHQALVEVRILQMLNRDFDPDDEKRLVRMIDFFVYRKHLCIAFELLSVNLYDVLKRNSFRGVSVVLIRDLTEQLLKAMQCLRDAFVIHGDLKPENVLLMDMQHTRIKLIDFGSACFEKHSVYSYIQSRFYRSPEVMLGLPYTSAIDMWSLGCICAELFLGLPVFPGHSEYNQVCRIAEILGNPPSAMLEMGRSSHVYFRRVEEDAASEGVVDNGSECSTDKAQAQPAPHGTEESDDEARPGESAWGHSEVPQEHAASPGEAFRADEPQASSATVVEAWAEVSDPRPKDSKKRSGTEGQSEGGHSASSTLSTAAETVEASRTSGWGNGRRAQNVAHRGRRCTAWRLKTREEYEQDERKKEPTPKKYFEFKSLEQMLELIPYKSISSQVQLKEEQNRRLCFHQLLCGMLQLNPDERWTPKQAAHHTFISDTAYDPNFNPPPDVPVPSFITAPLPGLQPVEVPRLPAEAMVPFGAYTGGGSARTVEESAGRERSSGSMDAEQPRSAPASVRGQAAAGRPAGSGRSGVDGELDPAAVAAGMYGPGTLIQPDVVVPGLRFPDDNSDESYRPPIDKMPENFSRSIALSRYMRGTSQQVSHEAGSPPKARSGGWSVSMSSASSAGSTPGGRGRRSLVSQHSAGSSAGGPAMKAHSFHSALPPESKAAGAFPHRLLPGPTGTPASSPHGSAASAAAHAAGVAAGGGGTLAQTPHRHHPAAAGGMPANPGSRNGSRGSSPWHMSELSTGSDPINSQSEPESDMANPADGAQDPSRSSRSDDSIRTTPRTDDGGEPGRPPPNLGAKLVAWGSQPLGPSANNFRKATGQPDVGPVRLPFQPAQGGRREPPREERQRAP